MSAVSRQGRDSATRLRALERLQDAEEILNVALKAEHTDTAVAALERLTDVSALTEVSQRARNKVAGRRARAKLRLMAEAARPSAAAEIPMAAEDRQRALDLLHRAEGLVALPDPDEAGRGLAAIRLAWAELQADVELDAALVQQFEAASDAVREAIAERQQERAAEEERARTIAREQADRTAICEEIEAPHGSGRSRPDRRAQGPVGQPPADAVGVCRAADPPLPGRVPDVRGSRASPPACGGRGGTAGNACHRAGAARCVRSAA